MKKTKYLFLAASVLLAGLTACTSKEESQEEIIDLRYRVQDEYTLPATSPQAFTIVVKSSHAWTIRSYHPDWCIIEQEDGEAVDAALVHEGKGENTTVRVQYYDNTSLDDRIDYIEIASGYWVGKTVTIYQKGTAYLRVPEADIEGGLDIAKAGGELTLNVLTNQKWSAKIVPEGSDKAEWLSVTAGEAGELDGTVTVTVQENPGEKRYSNVAVYDRNGEERAMIHITQDGVQLDPATTEIRAGYDQLSASLHVVSNTKWVAEKSGETDWFEIDNPSGHNLDGDLTITLTANTDGTSLRKSSIIIKTVPTNADDPVIQKEIQLKQAYPIQPVRKLMDNDEIGSWKSDWANPPVYTKDYGTLFTAKCRLNQGSMPFGTYTFRWKDWQAGARIRHWFCFSDGIEMKADIRPVDAKIGFDFNAASSGKSGKPSVDAYTAIDWTQPIELTYKFDPSGAEHCHVTYLVNGVVAGSFDTSDETLHTVTWGSKINMYIGCDQVSGQDPGSAVLEWYEFTEPINWDE